MPWTTYPDVDALLIDLLGRMQAVLGGKLTGLYLYGSLVAADFDHAISDIDLLAVLSSGLGERELDGLHRMHDGFAAGHSFWYDRIEAAYVPAAALKTFRTQASTIAVISPGEPFHTKGAGSEWLMNWWMVREQGVTLYGPPPATLIGPISREEFLQNVREHTLLWSEWIEEMRHRKAQSYAIITACRALYAINHGEQASKKRAAGWVQERYPQWAALIGDALSWRASTSDEGVDHEATYPETVRFVSFARGQIAAG